MKYTFNPNKIRGLMAEKRITQKLMANYLGISENSLREKLNDRVDFKDSEICSVASFLDVQPDIFFTSKFGDTPKQTTRV
jgi:transcriptional regulator with XRE-family HTH domain